VSKARFFVEGHFDKQNGVPQKATIVIDRDNGLFTLRIHRRHGSQVLPLSAIAEMVYRKVIATEVAEAKPKRRKPVSRGLLTMGR
jgi:hypothetical protein